MGLYSRAQLERDLAAAEAFDQEISRRVAEGSLSGFIAVTIGREVEAKIRGLRMQLVNAGQMISDLKAAKSELATAESQSQVDQANFRLRAAWKKIKFNSDGVASLQDGVSEALAAPRSHEVDLGGPEGLAEANEALKRRQRVVWRPNGRDVARIFED